jgi:DNA-binding PadR family transcriptional regulator
MLPDLDPLLHSQLRLAIMSTAISKQSTTFNELKEITEASSGNISVQLKKLQKAGYIEIIKGYKDNYPHTSIQITKKGIEAFEHYVEALSNYLSKK